MVYLEENDVTLYGIYVLADPRTNVVRYVGVSKNPHIRFKQHLRGDANIEKTSWIHELLQQGLLPRMEIMEEVQGTRNARLCEAKWINFFRTQKLPLTNWNLCEHEGGLRIDDPELSAAIEEELMEGRRLRSEQ